MLQHLESTELQTLRRRMVAFARRSLRDQHAAEDATQEALAALLQSGAGFRGESAWQTYAFGVLSHKITDIQRQRGREVAAEEDQLHATDVADEPAVPLASNAREGFWREARLALAQLPARERTAFWLREISEWPTAAVCAHMGVKANHVHVLLHRARQGLRKQWPHAALPA